MTPVWHDSISLKSGKSFRFGKGDNTEKRNKIHDIFLFSHLFSFFSYWSSELPWPIFLSMRPPHPFKIKDSFFFFSFFSDDINNECVPYFAFFFFLLPGTFLFILYSLATLPNHKAIPKDVGSWKEKQNNTFRNWFFYTTRKDSKNSLTLLYCSFSFFTVKV